MLTTYQLANYKSSSTSQKEIRSEILAFVMPSEEQIGAMSKEELVLNKDYIDVYAGFVWGDSSFNTDEINAISDESDRLTAVIDTILGAK